MATSRVAAEVAEVLGYGIGIGDGAVGVLTSAFDAPFVASLSDALGVVRLPEQPHASAPTASTTSPAERSRYVRAIIVPDV